MSLDKAIRFGKEKRKKYRGSARFDYSCRHGGSCGYCKGNRLYSAKVALSKADIDIQTDEWFGYHNIPDGQDTLTEIYERELSKIGMDVWDFYFDDVLDKMIENFG